jgi:hypothetical protein
VSADELELFTLAEVMAIMKRSRRTLYRDRDAGRLEIIYPFGPKAPRVTREALERYRSGAASDTIPPYLKPLQGGKS